MSPLTRAASWASFVKVEHTLFSLPVMFAGAFLAAGAGRSAALDADRPGNGSE